MMTIQKPKRQFQKKKAYLKRKLLKRFGDGKDQMSYEDWLQKAIAYKGLDDLKGYDYQGWYNEDPKRAYAFLNDDPEAHFDDKYKTVYHPTFSDQSIYSGVVHPVFNPNGLKGGKWISDHKYISPRISPVSMDDRINYVNDAENDGVQIRTFKDEPLWMDDGTRYDGVLPNVIIKPKHNCGKDKFNEGTDDNVANIYYDSATGRYYAAPSINKYTEDVEPVVQRGTNKAMWDFVGKSGKRYTTKFTDEQIRYMAQQDAMKSGSEFYTYIDKAGNEHRSTNIIPLSPNDPLMSVFVETAAMGPAFKVFNAPAKHFVRNFASDFGYTKFGKWVGKKYNNYVANKVAKELDKAVNKYEGSNAVGKIDFINNVKSTMPKKVELTIGNTLDPRKYNIDRNLSSRIGGRSIEELESPPIDLMKIAENNTQIVREDGSINMHMLKKAVDDFMNYPQTYGYPHSGTDPATIINNGKSFTHDNPTNLYQHILNVVKTARQIPVPKGYTRQDLVQSALYHDIGKIYNSAQGEHEKVGADLLRNLMRSGHGIMPVQRIKDVVIDAIENHGRSHNMVDQSGLTQALHFADVARGLSYYDAAWRYPQLLTYDRYFPTFTFKDNIPLRDQLKTVINPILKRYGYNTIPLNSTREEAEQLVNFVIDTHRTFVRGAKNIIDPDIMKQAITSIAKEDTHAGARGISNNRSRFGINEKDYGQQYVSTNAQILRNYGQSERPDRPNGRYVVRIPQNEISKTSESLPERLMAGDFEQYDARAVHADAPPIGTFSMYEEPYRLQTGRSLKQDMIEEARKSGYQRVVKKPTSDVFLDDVYGISISDGRPITHGDKLNEANKILKSFGLSEIRPYEMKYSDQGLLIRPPVMKNSRQFYEMLKNLYIVRNISKTASADISFLHNEKILRFLKNHNVSDRQIDAAVRSKNIKYLNLKNVAAKIKDAYYKYGTFQFNNTGYAKIMTPKNMDLFMRKHGALPRYEYKTFNEIRTVTPNEHKEDAVKQLTSKNKIIPPMQIGIIGKRGEQVVDIVKPVTEKIDDLTKHVGYRDFGNTFTETPLSRKTLK